MNREQMVELLRQVKSGAIEIDAAVQTLKQLPFEDVGYAKIDHHRELRQGFPEVIFGQGKTARQVMGIMGNIGSRSRNVLATRISPDLFGEISQFLPDAEYHEMARCVTILHDREPRYKSPVLIISAGTSDLPVAEEAAVSAIAMGNTVVRLYDVGVAGIHRLFHFHETINKSAVIIVVAGMEGALASVVGGLVQVPVIGVPTSVGYGANFAGLSALLGMLNSCASGVSVVNIDNGFGAAAMATSIIRLKEES